MNSIHTTKALKQAAKAALLLLLMAGKNVKAQSVSEIITDYNGYYKSSTTSINPVKPDNDHNLLAFSFNGTRYSTGANDALLTSHSETFTPANFRALPLNTINGTPTANTKIGLGAMADGVYNGPGSTAPSRNLGQYLNDGINGLNLGTCVANLPVGTMFMSVSNLQPAQVGDGVPDIVVTQTADPSSRADRYSFTDINGNRVGNYVDINLTNIAAVGQWTADFYEATGSTVLAPGFTQTSRSVRLWAADFAAFGINASNINQIAYFKIDLSGDSDIAFVAYNTTTVTVQQVLAIPANTPRIQRTNNNEEPSTVRAFPNPASSAVTIAHPSAKGGETILIYSLNGSLIMQRTISSRSTQTSININALPAGTYQAIYSDGIRKYAQKLVKI